MSNFADGFAPSFNPAELDDGWYPKLKALFPSIALALIGEEDWERDRSKRPPYSVIIANRDGKLKFTLSNPTAARTYHAPIVDAVRLLESIEGALANNQGDWVSKRQNGTSNSR